MRKFLTLFFIGLSQLVVAQNKPFWGEIRHFQTADSVSMPPENAILFVGSSSFRMWKDLEQYFPGRVIINRGFGGSSLPHVIEYADEIITPYKPKQVVIYCGENDFMSDTVTSAVVTDRFKKLFALIRRDLPRAEIVYVSMKPSPSRRQLMSEIASANKAIERFLKKQPRARFVNIWDPMLDEKGEPREELFLADMLHMNAKGYAIWKDALEPLLR